MRRAHFSDADHLGEVVRHASVEVTVARGRTYRGGLVTLAAEGLTIQWGSHGVPSIVRGQTQGPVLLTAWGGCTPARCEGQPLGGGAVFYPSGSELQGRTDGPCSWVGVSLSGLGRHAAALTPHADVLAGARRRIVDGMNEHVLSLRAALQEARRTVDSGLIAQWSPSAALALTDRLGAAAVLAAAGEEPQRASEHIGACSALVRRADAFLRAQHFQPITLSVLCAATHASEARLREAFQRIYGTGPSAYLRLRRFHLVRLKLKTTCREECSVSAAAASLGFFELGRFAGEYRALFGELPSQTRRSRL